MNELAFTGERFVPGAKGEIWIEHWHRYHFAARWCAGKRVLDVACGEGH
jgi:2-polyprenyl-3-methyl-5-hydroxy-6-metoxy-1,4-benzoquinol methylase